MASVVRHIPWLRSNEIVHSVDITEKGPAGIGGGAVGLSRQKWEKCWTNIPWPKQMVLKNGASWTWALSVRRGVRWGVRGWHLLHALKQDVKHEEGPAGRLVQFSHTNNNNNKKPWCKNQRAMRSQCSCDLKQQGAPVKGWGWMLLQKKGWFPVKGPLKPVWQGVSYLGPLSGGFPAN